MELAENLALDHDYDKELGKRLKEAPQNGGYHYVNAKKLNLKDPEEEEDGSPDFEKYYSVDRSVDDPKFMVGYSRLNLEANKYFSGKIRQVFQRIRIRFLNKTIIVLKKSHQMTKIKNCSLRFDEKTCSLRSIAMICTRSKIHGWQFPIEFLSKQILLR